MTDDRKYTLDEQKAIFEKHKDRACGMLEQMTKKPGHNQLKIDAYERAFRKSDIGFAQYGDAAFHKSEAELFEEARAELGDAVFYFAVMLEKMEQRHAEEAKRVSG